MFTFHSFNVSTVIDLIPMRKWCITPIEKILSFTACLFTFKAVCALVFILYAIVLNEWSLLRKAISPDIKETLIGSLNLLCIHVLSWLSVNDIMSYFLCYIQWKHITTHQVSHPLDPTMYSILSSNHVIDMCKCNMKEHMLLQSLSEMVDVLKCSDDCPMRHKLWRSFHVDLQQG